MKRYFIALNLPQNVKDEFAKIQSNLKTKNSQIRVVWVHPEIAHINLHFLGNLDKNGVNQLKQNLKALKGKYRPILAILNSVEAFPNLKIPRILFLGIKNKRGDNLIKLHAAIGKILKNQNLQIDQRPFITHITLGRVKDEDKNIKFSNEKVENIEFKIDSFELMESILTPSGPKYKIIQSYKL